MKISMIAAVADNGVIGKDNKLPWNIKEDLRRFKQFTEGKAIVMGRNTWVSIGCKPLQGRRNVILSSSLTKVKGAEVFSSLPKAFDELKSGGEKEVVIIGGPSVYAEALPTADVICLTRVHTSIEKGDAFFPFVYISDFVKIKEEEFFDGIKCTYQEWVRR